VELGVRSLEFGVGSGSSVRSWELVVGSGELGVGSYEIKRGCFSLIRKSSS